MSYLSKEKLHQSIFAILDRPGPVCFEFRERVRLFIEDYNPKQITDDIKAMVNRFVAYTTSRGKNLGSSTWDMHYLQAVHTLCIGKMPIYYRNAWVTPGVQDTLGMEDTAKLLPAGNSFDRLYGYMMCLEQYIRKHGIHPADLQSMLFYIANIKTTCLQSEVSDLLYDNVRLFEREFYSYMKKVMTNVQKIEERVLFWSKQRYENQ